ncbi:MAG: DUF4159 domain-containing protein [Woeseiaceae bacterium]|nr:DUF4159 domain-containing protein [Woeseiaceae bacterium]
MAANRSAVIGKIPKTCIAFLLLSAVTATIGGELAATPDAEFHMARMMYSSGNGDRMWRPWWAIDYPDAEYHFTRALRRLTALDVADDSQHLRLTDDELFDYPWLFAQQVGHWQLDDREIAALREYVLRGGFVVVDDFHGEFEWFVFTDAMRRAFPEWPITPLPGTHPLMTVMYSLDQGTQIPGRRHLYRSASGEVEALLHGPAQWHGIYDDNQRLVVAINFNMDMGDAWEHADDPVYPLPMTALAYRFAVNYVIYAMTH